MNVANAEVILKEMENLGTEQARKIYKRYGVGDDTLGVSYADLNKFQKQLKINHEIALDLWNSDIHDAQVLALMIADPQRADSKRLEQWAQTLTNSAVTHPFGVYVAKTSFAQAKAEAWIQSEKEWISTAGWNIMGSLATNDSTLPDSYFERLLQIIERDIHHAPNFTRYAMNNALIAIGGRNPALQVQAVAAARRVGKVEVDWGLTNCKTPDAVLYIQKVVDHKMEMAERKAAKRKVKA